VFHSMQKAVLMYGMGGNRLPPVSKVEYNPNLRPARTTMYEVGVEHVLPLEVVATVRGYAKYNVDQASDINASGHLIFRNTNYEDVRGTEIKLARSVGRFVNGWFTYESIFSRSGRTGFEDLRPTKAQMITDVAYSDVRDPAARMRCLLRVGTPLDWGPLAGGWSAGIVQDHRSGGEVIFNPDAVPRREIQDEYYIPTAAYWNTDLRLTKDTPLSAGRRVSVFVDITNLLNTKRLTGSAIGDQESISGIL